MWELGVIKQRFYIGGYMVFIKFDSIYNINSEFQCKDSFQLIIMCDYWFIYRMECVQKIDNINIRNLKWRNLGSEQSYSLQL